MLIADDIAKMPDTYDGRHVVYRRRAAEDMATRESRRRDELYIVDWHADDVIIISRIALMYFIGMAAGIDAPRVNTILPMPLPYALGAARQADAATRFRYLATESGFRPPISQD